MGVATAILSAVGLGFIGLGMEASVAEWGTMLNFGRGYIRTHPYLTIYPGIAIMLTILSFNLIGDGMRCHRSEDEREVSSYGHDHARQESTKYFPVKKKTFGWEKTM